MGFWRMHERARRHPFCSRGRTAIVRLWSRYGRNRTSDFEAITAAMRRLPADVLIDGEAVAHCQNGLPDFHRILSPARERVLLRPCECREKPTKKARP